MHFLSDGKVIRKMVTISIAIIVRRGCLVHGRTSYAYKSASGAQ
jgi:hypothetical protein